MASVVRLYEMTGTQNTGVGTGVDKTSATIRFKSVNETSVDSENRLSVPSAGGTTYSFTKQVQFFVDTAPVVDITNLRIYSDGTNNYASGLTLKYGTAGTFGVNVNTADHVTADFFGLTNTNSVDMRGTSTHGTFTGTLFKGGFMRLQMNVGPGALSGSSSIEVLTGSFDES